MEAESELGGYSGSNYNHPVLVNYRNVVELAQHRKPRVLVYHSQVRTHLSIWLDVNLIHPDMSEYVTFSDQNEIYRGDDLIEAVRAMHEQY